MKKFLYVIGLVFMLFYPSKVFANELVEIDKVYELEHSKDGDNDWFEIEPQNKDTILNIEHNIENIDGDIKEYTWTNICLYDGDKNLISKHYISSVTDTSSKCHLNKGCTYYVSIEHLYDCTVKKNIKFMFTEDIDDESFDNAIIVKPNKSIKGSIYGKTDVDFYKVKTSYFGIYKLVHQLDTKELLSYTIYSADKKVLKSYSAKQVKDIRFEKETSGGTIWYIMIKASSKNTNAFTELDYDLKLSSSVIKQINDILNYEPIKTSKTSLKAKITSLQGYQYNSYEVQYSTNPDMKNATMIASDKGTFVLKGLNKKTKYYVQVRGFGLTKGNKIIRTDWGTRGVCTTK